MLVSGPPCATSKIDRPSFSLQPSATSQRTTRPSCLRPRTTNAKRRLPRPPPPHPRRLLPLWSSSRTIKPTSSSLKRHRSRPSRSDNTSTRFLRPSRVNSSICSPSTVRAWIATAPGRRGRGGKLSTQSTSRQAFSRLVSRQENCSKGTSTRVSTISERSVGSPCVPNDFRSKPHQLGPRTIVRSGVCQRARA